MKNKKRFHLCSHLECNNEIIKTDALYGKQPNMPNMASSSILIAKQARKRKKKTDKERLFSNTGTKTK